MKYIDLLEAKTTTIYHGDDYGTKKLEPKLMMQDSGNSQEGVGIYFGDLETAETYGKNIVTAEINPKNFVDSRASWDEVLKVSDLAKLLKGLWKTDEETMYYMLTDWIEIMEPEDIEEYNLDDMAENMRTGEVRNIQIELAQQFGVESLVSLWNKILPKVHGTYQNQERDVWYAVINTKIKVKPV